MGGRAPLGATLTGECDVIAEAQGKGFMSEA